VTEQGFAAPPGIEAAPAPVRAEPGEGVTGGPAAPSAPAGRPGPRRPHRGPRLAWVVGGAAALAIGGGVAADVVLQARAGALAPVERGATGSLNSVQVVAGLCLTEPVDEAAVVGAVTAVPCADAHATESVAQLDLPGDEWPGAHAVARDATAFCAAQVARIVPADLADGIAWRVWAPSRPSWEAGDRTAVCVVSTAEPVTGSIEAGTAAPA